MAQELQIDSHTDKPVLVGYANGNYTKVVDSYERVIKKILKLHEDPNKGEIYTKILFDLAWDSNKRPQVRRIINALEKEILDEEK